MANDFSVKEIVRVLGEFSQIFPVLFFKQPKDSLKQSLGSKFEDTVAKYPNNSMLLFEGRHWTYAEFNREINQLAHYLQQQGVKRGDTVALVMTNRAEFVLSMMAIVKLGAIASLINNSLKGNALIHCIKETQTIKCIVGEECASQVNDVLEELENQLGLSANRDYYWVKDRGETGCCDWAIDVLGECADMPSNNLPVTRDIEAGEKALYIFTSGTTGLPKAANVFHRKTLIAGQTLGRYGFRIKPEDRLYLCLPIYHITGLAPGFCCFIFFGGSIYLRRNFSASNFWREVQEYKTNCFIYVGELCRYLCSQPESEHEKNNPLEKVLGNGLRPDVWDEFKQRFDIKRISEIYGASESNISFLNILNKDRTIGASTLNVKLVDYDLENDEIVRDKNGLCIEVPKGETGLLLGEINEKAIYDGYSNESESNKKIIQDVDQKGDRWFNTGDLIRHIDVGFDMGIPHFQFVDRTGDTFRWRSENVSTNEVGETLNQHPQIEMANVYGVEVPGVEGRAGMVAFELPEGESFDFQTFENLCQAQLPAYAQPVFIRILQQLETTGTFKLLKGDLREHAYHPEKVGSDPIYVKKPGASSYSKLEQDFYGHILNKSAGY